MLWHDLALRELSASREVALVNRGDSMKGRIANGQVVILCPVDHGTLAVGDMVMVRIRKGRFLVHLIQQMSGEKFLIGNNLGGLDGWVTRDAILAKARVALDGEVSRRNLVLLDEREG